MFLNKLKILISVLFWGALAFGAVETPTTLSLEDYLKQVKEKHEGAKALKESSEGALLRAEEASLLTRPSLFATVMWQDDKKPQANPAFSGTETEYLGYTLGVQEQFPFGLQTKLYYGLSHTVLTGTNPAFLPVPDFHEARPVLEFTQPLLRNGFGRETRATRDLVSSMAKAQGYGDSFKLQALLAEAETTYWSLALLRELVQVQSDSVERAQKIRDWNSKRAKLELADRSDLLQAEAGLQARTLEHQTAKDDMGQLERSFNRLRGSDTPVVSENLALITKESVAKLTPPEKKNVRGDVMAAMEAQKAALSNAAIGKEKNLPSLDLVGSIALNGRDAERGVATSISFKTTFPTLAFGVKFNAPLDIGSVSNAHEGYGREVRAAELQLSRKQFEDKEDWKELNARFAEAKRRLDMIQTIETAQSKKLEYERERLRRGRSVTYQVLLFEQDFLQAQALRIKTEAEMVRLISQMKLY